MLDPVCFVGGRFVDGRSEEAARAKEDLVERVKNITGTGVFDSVPLSKNPKKKSTDITRRQTRKSKTQVSHDGPPPPNRSA